MRIHKAFTIVAAAAALLAVAPVAAAKDPGRWRETGRSTLPLYYYQGIASNPAGNLFFNGIYTGLYRTDGSLHQTGRNDDIFPVAVHLTEMYDHIGDIAWDAREGGRILLPVECYYPFLAPGQDDQNNTCNTGSFGVADPVTLHWRYYVKLDPAEIPKAMWVAVSPDGELLWTQSGKDLLAYRAADVNPSNAAPAGPVIKAVQRVRNAVPPSGITGAAFSGGVMYAAGQDGDTFQVWSIDLATGARQLEIERQVVGESEGIDFFAGLGGTLHWLIQPFNTHALPTYGLANGTLLHFVPAGGAGAAQVGAPARLSAIRLAVSPRHAVAGRRTRFAFRASAMVGGRRQAVGGAQIRFAGHRARTDAKGRARVTGRLTRAGRMVARATAPSFRAGRATVRVVRGR
ncbi:MAG: hypothetical protein QOI98_2189 [Solirubrobacteraceae bacterium]|nr:hypothetical protein [Solirubrobacteraceae bacterium]